MGAYSTGPSYGTQEGNPMRYLQNIRTPNGMMSQTGMFGNNSLYNPLYGPQQGLGGGMGGNPFLGQGQGGGGDAAACGCLRVVG